MEVSVVVQRFKSSLAARKKYGSALSVLDAEPMVSQPSVVAICRKALLSVTEN